MQTLTYHRTYQCHSEPLKKHDNLNDEHGNITSMPHINNMWYDQDDQLKVAVFPNTGYLAFYCYDSSGERVRKVVQKPGIIEEHIYLGGYEVYRRKFNNVLWDERETLTISDDQKTIVRIETKKVENGYTITPVSNQRYQYDNHLGSACLELDSSANIISYEEYHPFGTTSYRAGSSQTEVSLKRYKYCGKERDEETGLYYYGARYYAAWLGRFVSVDPMQFKYPYYTPYQYAGNKPISYIDLDGLEPDDSNDLPNTGSNNPETEEPKIELPPNAYYKSDGTFLGFGSSNNNNEVYTADSITINEDGSKTFDNAIKIDDMTHTEFAKSANIIKHESSGDKDESLWIAHAANNASGIKDVGGKHTSMYSQLMDPNYSTTPNSARTELSTTDNSTSAKNARAAVIDVMNGEADPTGGAVLWDGTDFLAWGTDHNKFKEYGYISIDKDHLSSFISAQIAKYGNSVTYGDTEYELPHNVFSTSAIYGTKEGGRLVGGCRAGIWDAGFGKSGTGRYYDIKSTGTKGNSIFWKINSIN